MLELPVLAGVAGELRFGSVRVGKPLSMVGNELVSVEEPFPVVDKTGALEKMPPGLGFELPDANTSPPITGGRSAGKDDALEATIVIPVAQSHVRRSGADGWCHIICRWIVVLNRVH